MGTDGVVEWSVVEATELDVPTLYELLELRSAVFVVEQECAYRDPDGRDLVPGTRHVLGRRMTAQLGEQLVGRIRPGRTVARGGQHEHRPIGQPVEDAAEHGEGRR